MGSPFTSLPGVLLLLAVAAEQKARSRRHVRLVQLVAEDLFLAPCKKGGLFNPGKRDVSTLGSSISLDLHLDLSTVDGFLSSSLVCMLQK